MTTIDVLRMAHGPLRRNVSTSVVRYLLLFCAIAALAIEATTAVGQTPGESGGDVFSVETGREITAAVRACAEARLKQENTAADEYHRESRACRSDDRSCLLQASAKYNRTVNATACQYEQCQLQAFHFANDCTGAKRAALAAAQARYQCEVRDCGNDRPCLSAAFTKRLRTEKEADNTYAQCSLRAQLPGADAGPTRGSAEDRLPAPCAAPVPPSVAAQLRSAKDQADSVARANPALVGNFVIKMAQAMAARAGMYLVAASDLAALGPDQAPLTLANPEQRTRLAQKLGAIYAFLDETVDNIRVGYYQMDKHPNESVWDLYRAAARAVQDLGREIDAIKRDPSRAAPAAGNVTVDMAVGSVCAWGGRLLVSTEEIGELTTSAQALKRLQSAAEAPGSTGVCSARKEDCFWRVMRDSTGDPEFNKKINGPRPSSWQEVYAELSKYFGKKFMSVPFPQQHALGYPAAMTLEDIATALSQAGAGAEGIVFVGYPNGDSHVFMGANLGSGAVFIDDQKQFWSASAGRTTVQKALGPTTWSAFYRTK